MRLTCAATLPAVLAACALVSPPSASADAVTHQADAAHTGHARVPGLDPPLHRAWTRRFPDVMSYPVIGGGRVFVVAYTGRNDGNTQASELIAMSLRSGRVLWRRGLGRGVGGQLGLEGGRVFVTRGGYEVPALEAFGAADGRSLWRVDLQTFSAEPPVPADGAVYLSLQGNVHAFDAGNGAMLWNAVNVGGESDAGTPAIQGDSVWVTFACEHVARLRRSDGGVVWSHEPPCHGGGAQTAALYRGRLFSTEGHVTEPSFVYDAESGSRIRPLFATAPLAFAGGLGFFPDGNIRSEGSSGPYTIKARSVRSGRRVWRFRGDGYLDGTPLVVNDTLYAGSGSGVLYGLSTRTGRVRWRDRLPVPFLGPVQAWDMQTGLAAAEGTLVVPALRRLVAYR
jgi:outer membrane protein assembly factor BamB